MIYLIQCGLVPRRYQRGHPIMIGSSAVVAIVDAANVLAVVPYYRHDQYAIIVPNNVCGIVMIIIIPVALSKFCSC